MATMPEVQCDVSEYHPVFDRTIRRAASPRRAAFIGTRRIDDVSRLAHDTYLSLVERAVAKGMTVRTGAAKGADQIAAMRALHLGGHVELVLPWPEYEARWVNEVTSEFGTLVDYVVYDPDEHVAWTESVRRYHPAPQALKPYAWSLHARNYGIVEPCEIVVALCAPDREGGTEQGIRIAEGLGKNRVILASNDNEPITD